MQQANTPTSQGILSVSRLNRMAKRLLESEIGTVWLSAEVSNFVSAASGHWYFTLKDERAQVKAAMFKSTNRYLRQRPKEGDKILVRASVGLYEPRGDYQLIVEHMESDGEGQLKRAFDTLKEKLNALGLFDSAVKRPLPSSIRRVGIITSSSGAALHDALTVFKRRSPATHIIIYPTMVQGVDAPRQIINAIKSANNRKEVDVLLLTRGGGSLEDLWCFNDEQLAHCIRDSSIPIVSAVGHEVDFTIADFVADLRAPTPSAGAELLSQDINVMLEALRSCETRMKQSLTALQHRLTNKMQLLQHRLASQHPKVRIQTQQQSLDRLQIRLVHSIEQRVSQLNKQHAQKVQRLWRQDPSSKVEQAKLTLSQFKKGLNRSMLLLLEDKKRTLAYHSQSLNAVSPLATLARGYSITFDENERALTEVSKIEIGQAIRTKLRDGEILSKVDALLPADNPKK
ncbi:exodeoxyribonuclease VII large subunit [Alteromonas sp. ASW11-130]|uniref:exodeoxyribonuclease VII large subunit n=1 Tax=Alteromonas sp. ASW11-130 TaxID=3015775 RepID=UPI002242BB5C|nr:exodeoxyribonuclease VII large subunit [Alteromonas sp. ASW11-130]MCW8091526.1 exodeoxyribonuclease VII large subunit [Alteromonas sp. ASW11-130]